MSAAASAFEHFCEIDQSLTAVLARPPEERASILAGLRAENSRLARAVTELLQLADEEDALLVEGGALLGGLGQALAYELGGPDATATGKQIGPWRIVREIGRGGMAVVYLAERADGAYEQQVALKLLQAGPRGSEQVLRFERERQILASLKHPNIAALVDGGLTEDGQPWFAMEYVAEERFDRYCDHHRLGVDQRLKLFIQVARTVQAAHQALVVHRDLKPSNILVTQEGEPRLLDFGIAKPLDPESALEQVTRTGQMLTPAYASPEQIRGSAVNTATDVYQLGLLLYELLTGVQAQRPGGRSAAELERIVIEHTPPAPSVAAATGETAAMRAAARRSTPPELARRLRGDLDAIVLQALRKEPERRYGSVAEMAEDVRRHLAAQPVTARPDAWTYRARKFVDRHTLGVVATMGVLAGVAVLVAFYTARLQDERDRSEEAAQLARLEADKSAQVTEFLMGLFEANDPRESAGETVTALDLLARGLQHVETLGEQPEVQAQMLDVMGHVYRSLGQYDQALPLLQRAAAIRRDRLGAEHPDVAGTLHELASVLKDQGEYQAAEALFREALAMRRTLLGEEHPEVAESLNSLGSLLADTGDYEAAEPLLHEALALQRKRLGREHVDVATTLNNLGLLLMEMGDYDQAEAMHREALAMRLKLLGEDHLDVTYSLNNLALNLHYRGDYDAAEPLYRELIELDRKILGEDHPDYALDLNNLGGLLKNKGEYGEAEALYREALAIYTRSLGSVHPRIAQSLQNIAGVRLALEDYDGAELLYREALAMRRSLLGEEHPAVATTMSNLGLVLKDKGDFAAAEPLLRESLEMRRKTLGEEHPGVALSLHNLALLHILRGEYESAASLYREAIEINTAALGGAHWQTAYYRSGLGSCLTALDRFAEAEPLLLEAYGVLQQERGDENRFTRKVLERLVTLYEAWDKPDEAARHREALQRAGVT